MVGLGILHTQAMEWDRFLEPVEDKSQRSIFDDLDQWPPGFSVPPFAVGGGGDPWAFEFHDHVRPEHDIIPLGVPSLYETEFSPIAIDCPPSHLIEPISGSRSLVSADSASVSTGLQSHLPPPPILPSKPGPEIRSVLDQLRLPENSDLQNYERRNHPDARRPIALSRKWRVKFRVVLSALVRVTGGNRPAQRNEACGIGHVRKHSEVIDWFLAEIDSAPVWVTAHTRRNSPKGAVKHLESILRSGCRTIPDILRATIIEGIQ
jgi:hypothetical protein